MAILEIKKYPEQILKKKAVKVKEITPEIKKLAKDMTETMLRAEPEGVGLAAPQIGLSKRLFVAQTPSGPAVFINPQIIKKSRERESMEEGCLSLPGTWINVKRAKRLGLEYLDTAGKKRRIKAEGLFARILQHEIDHLNGILIIHRVSFWRKLSRTLTLGRGGR